MKILSDSSKYSRRNLSDAIFGKSYVAQCEMVSTGSDSLLRAIWREHTPLMIHAARCGRLVVRP